MANENIFQQVIKPVTPKVLAQERIYVHVPQASVTNKGIATYDATQFQVNGGVVKIRQNDPMAIPTIIQIDKDDFVYENGVVEINWSYAHDKSGSARTNGYGLIKIADNSENYLKYTDDGLLALDTDKLDTKYISAANLNNKLDASYKTDNSVIKLSYETDDNKYGSFNMLVADNEEDSNAIALITTNINSNDSTIGVPNGQIILSTMDSKGINQINLAAGSIDIYNTAGINISTTSTKINGAELVVGKHTFNETTTEVGYREQNQGGLELVVTETDSTNSKLYQQVLTVTSRGTIYYAEDKKNDKHSMVIIGFEGAGIIDDNLGFHSFATLDEVNSKIQDIVSINIRNIDKNAIEATTGNVQAIATAYIVNNLGRQPKDYDGLFITLTDQKNDVVEFAYFNEIWINTGLNGVDLSNYVTKDEMPKANNGEDTTSTLDTLKVDGVNYKLGGGEVDGTTIVKTSENKLQVVGMTNGTEEITASDIISALTIERL